MTDSLSYADRARKAISPSNLAAISTLSPLPLDDWPKVGSQTKPSPHPQKPSQEKVIFGSIGLESPPLRPPPPSSHSSTEIPTKTPTFSVGLTEPLPARLRSRTRPEDPDDISPPESSIKPPNKWKFGTMATPVNGKKTLPDQDSSPIKLEPSPPPSSSSSSSSSSSLLFQPDCQPNSKPAISFGYIDTPLPLDNTNISTPNKSKTKSKTKPKTKLTKLSPSPVQLDLKLIPDDDANLNPNIKEDSDPDFTVKDFGYGFGSGAFALAFDDAGQAGDAHNESADKQDPTTPPDQSRPHTRPVIRVVTAPIDDIQQPSEILPIHAPVPVPTDLQLYGPPTQPHGHHLHSRPSRRGNSFANITRGAAYERGGYERGGRRGGRGGINGYSRGYPSGRGYNRGGTLPASSHSSPGGAGQRAPYVENITPPPLPLHFSQFQQHDSIYYPPRHGAPPGAPFDPYQPYSHLQHQPHMQQHQHLSPHLQSYPHHFQQQPPPLPHILASASGRTSRSPIVPSASDDVPSDSTTTTSTSTSTSPPNAPSSTTTTPPPPSTTPPSAHIPPPVPIPSTILPFALDPTRYYLLGQLEYYLSPQNMVQDFFLRTQMDSKGYIPISLLASFNRIKQLTLDTRLVREVLTLSAFVEVRGGMVRMGGVGASPGMGQGIEGQGGQQNQNQGGWEAFVLPDAAQSVVEDIETPETAGGYGYHNGYGGYGSGYGYGYGGSGPGGSGYGYGYGYGYPPASGPGLGYYEEPQPQQQQQQQQQQQGGGAVDEPGLTFAHDQQQHHQDGEAVSSMINGHDSDHKLDDSNIPHSSNGNENEENKPNGIGKHEEEGEEEEEYEEDEEEEDVVFVMGTDAGTSWTPERERRA